MVPRNLNEKRTKESGCVKTGRQKARALCWVFASLVTEAPLRVDTRVRFSGTGASLNILNKEKVTCESLLLKSFHYARLRIEQLVTIPAQPCQFCVLICLFRVRLLNETKIDRQINHRVSNIDN